MYNLIILNVLKL